MFVPQRVGLSHTLSLLHTHTQVKIFYLISYWDSLWLTLTDTHTDTDTRTHSNPVGESERDRLHLTIQQPGLLPLSTLRSPISSLSHRRLLQWCRIDLLSTTWQWDRVKDAEKGTKRYRARKERQKLKDVINVPERFVVAVVIVRTWLYLFFEHVWSVKTIGGGEKNTSKTTKSPHFWNDELRAWLTSNSEFSEVIC